MCCVVLFREFQSASKNVPTSRELTVVFATKVLNYDRTREPAKVYITHLPSYLPSIHPSFLPSFLILPSLLPSDDNFLSTAVPTSHTSAPTSVPSGSSEGDVSLIIKDKPDEKVKRKI